MRETGDRVLSLILALVLILAPLTAALATAGGPDSMGTNGTSSVSAPLPQMKLGGSRDIPCRDCGPGNCCAGNGCGTTSCATPAALPAGNHPVTGTPLPRRVVIARTTGWTSLPADSPLRPPRP